MKRAAVLLVGLHAALDRRLQTAFESAGAEPIRAAGAREALDLLRTRPVAVLVAPRDALTGPGFDLAARAARLRPQAVLVAVADLEDSERESAFRSGLFDVISPSADGSLGPVAGRTLAQAGLLAELHRLREAARVRAGLGGLVGRSDALRRAREEIARLASEDRPVLVVGESGTGKEHGARFLHSTSRRASGPFLIVETRGGADADPFSSGRDRGKESAWERAAGGTLFVRDVCELLPDVQDRLAAALDGASPTLGPRLVAGCESDPDLAARTGRIPPALRARFDDGVVRLPPLRERREDVPFLTRHFLEVIREVNDLAGLRMTREASDLLVAHDWPGNVRELRTAVEHAALVADEGLVRPRDLPEGIRRRTESALSEAGSAEKPFREAKREVVDRFEREFLEQLLDRHAGNVTEAASASRMMRSALQRLLRKHRIRSSAYRSRSLPAPEPPC